MKIPKAFQILGMKISVVFDEDLYDRKGCLGLVKYRENKIYLQPNTLELKLADDKIENIFFHELTHLVLYNSEGKDIDDALCNDEILVNRISGLLHQVFSTMEYSE